MNIISIALWFTASLVLFLGPILLIHELGHFLAAKRVGARVEEFGIGFPPRLFTLTRENGWMRIGSTKVNLPGQLKLPGELEKGKQVKALTRREEDGTYRALSLRVSSDEDPVDSPSHEQTQEGVQLHGEVTALEPGTRYSINLLPFGAFVKMTGEEDPSDPRSLAAQPRAQRLLVLLAGPVLNLLVAFLIFATSYMTGYPQQFHVRVEYIQPDSAADASGIETGDILFSIDGTRIENGSEQVQEIVYGSAEETLDLYVVRDGEMLRLTATPREVDGHGFLGVAMSQWPISSEVESYSPPRAFIAAGRDMGTIFATFFQIPRLLAQGEISPNEVRPASAVGINALLTFSLQQSLEWNVAYPALHTAALVSLALGITNLLPLPALDGGRALFVVIEAIRGRRINPEIESRIHFAMLMILLALMAFIVVQDVVNPLIPWSRLSQ